MIDLSLLIRKKDTLHLDDIASNLELRGFCYSLFLMSLKKFTEAMGTGIGP